MSKEDIDRAVKDAEMHAAEDKERKEAVEVKNHGESLVFQSQKTLSEIGDKLSEDDKQPVRNAIEKLQETLKTDNTAAIKADTEALEQAFYKLSEKLYQQQPNPQNPDMGGDAGGNADGVYDADFTDKTE